jgi:flavin-dependent dehydrogenase
VLLTGDAGSFVDPLTGEGIYYALKSEQLAADAVSKAFNAKDAKRAANLYKKLWRKEFLLQDFASGYLLQSLLNNAHVLEWLMQFTAKKQSRADLLADVIAHNRKKIELLQLFHPFS